MFQKILCPIDLGEFTKPQLEFARSFALSQNAKLGALYVIPVTAGLYDVASLAQIQHEWEQSARKRVLEYCGKDITAHLGYGLIVAEIASVAETEKYDLILMPTHGFHGVKGFFLGSNFQSLLSKTACPILALPPHFIEKGEMEFKRPNVILCAIDLQKGSESLVNITEKVAKEFQATFIIMHSLSIERELLPFLLPERMSGVKEDVRARILKEHPYVSRGENLIVERGPAYERITRCTEENHVDLIVFGISRKPGFKLRSTLYRTVAELKIPALCVPV